MGVASLEGLLAVASDLRKLFTLLLGLGLTAATCVLQLLSQIIVFAHFFLMVGVVDDCLVGVVDAVAQLRLVCFACCSWGRRSWVLVPQVQVLVLAPMWLLKLVMRVVISVVLLLLLLHQLAVLADEGGLPQRLLLGHWGLLLLLGLLELLRLLGLGFRFPF